LMEGRRPNSVSRPDHRIFVCSSLAETASSCGNGMMCRARRSWQRWSN